MRRSSEEGYAVFRSIAGLVTKRYRLLVVGWILIFVAALLGNSIWRTEDVITFSTPLPEDTPSGQAQRILEEQFPRAIDGSTATIVIVADNATTEPFRWFVWDLDAAITTAASLDAGETATVPLRVGGNFTLDRPLEYLGETSSSTIYKVYANTAALLARQLNGPVHDNVTFVQASASIYWGLPAYFLQVWTASPGPFQNETARAATEMAIRASFPPPTDAWPNASFQTFYQMWNASWSNASMASFPPNLRAETEIARALPAFLSSPVARTLLGTDDPAAYAFQLGLLQRPVPGYDLTNFQDPTRAERYVFTAFASLGAAPYGFLAAMYGALPADPTAAEIETFAREFALGYDVRTIPLKFPVDVTRFYVSPDRTIVLMHYAFTEDERFTVDGRQPVKAGVLEIRRLVAIARAAYALDADVYVTGSAPLGVDQEFLLGGGKEFVATIVLVIVLIGLYFRSVLSPAFPILNIAIALMVANLFVYVVAVYLFDLHFTVTAVLQTVLLATGTDYSIFIISRYRDERRDGRDTKEAVRNAGIWAGESVGTSGGAVLIAFAALSLGSFPIVQGMGLTIGFAVTVSLGIALTFIPAILLLLGDRVFWPSGKRVATVRPPGAHTASERYFHGAADFSMRHAKAVVLAALLITLPALYMVLTDQPTFDLGEGVPATESSEGIDAIGGAFGEGFIFPAFLVARFPDPVVLPDGNVSIPAFDAVQGLTARILAEEPGVFSLEGPTNPQGTAVDYRNLSAMPPVERQSVLLAISSYIGQDDRTVRIQIVFRDPAFSREAIETVDRLKVLLAEIQSTEPGLRGAEMHVGGVSAILGDVRDSTNRDLQVMAAIVTIGLFLVLLFVLGSVLIPLRAILTILLSIVWTLGLTILLFHAWLGIDVIFVLPLVLFVMAMGLGMDYDIFIITRVREEVAKGKSDRNAILESVTRTGGIITACGVVMAGAFATLMLSPLPFLKEIGFALAFAILLDSSVVRIYLVPAIMVLAGRYNWWAPGGLQRVRREEPEDAK